MDWPRTDEAVKSWLAGQLKLAAISEPLWELLVSAGFVWPALDEPSAETFGELERAARQFMRLAIESVRPAARGRAGRRARSTSLLLPSDVGRAAAVSRFLGRLAGEETAVRQFREQVLGGQIASAAQADGLLGSPTLYLLSVDELRSSFVPLWDHEASVDYRREETGKSTWNERVGLKLRWAGQSKTYDFVIPRSVHDGMWIDLPPQFWGRKSPLGGEQPFVRPGSALDELRKASRWLTQRFPWTAWGGVWFVLTDVPPVVSPIEVGSERRSSRRDSPDSEEVFGRDVLTLTVDLWVSAQSVSRVFRAYQRELLGARNRPLQERALAVFEFVTGRRGIARGRMNWPELMKEWNHGHPDRQYADFRAFRGAYTNARERILLPKRRPIRPIKLW